MTWATGIDLKTGRPNFVPENRPGDPTAGADGKKGNVGVRGAVASWAARTRCRWPTRPDTKLFYVPANEWGMEIWNEPITYKKGAAYLGAGFTIKTLNDGPIGAMRAIDPKTGKIVWEATNNAPLWGGVLTTGGNLVFWGTPEGFLQAADAKTGKIVWKFQTGSGVVAPPITWERQGRAVRRRGLGLGRCGAAVGRRRGQEGQLPRAGRLGVGVQADEVSSPLRRCARLAGRVCVRATDSSGSPNLRRQIQSRGPQPP